MKQYHWMRYAGCAFLALLFICISQTVVAAKEITVNSKATGRFGQHPSGFGGIALDMVAAFKFDGPSTIEITATGRINLFPGHGPLEKVSPDGKSIRVDRKISGFSALEEATVDSGIDPDSLPNVIEYAGALIGAFVPQMTVDAANFLPRNEDYGVPGIASDKLFVIGSGPCEFTATEPGTLFLGINDNRAGNNIGSFTIKIQVSPDPSDSTPPSLCTASPPVSGPQIARAATGNRHYIQEDDTPLHESPNTNAPIVTQLKRGDRVIEYRRQGVWVKVGVFGAVGKEGWVNLSRIGPEPHAPTALEEQEVEDETIVGTVGTPPIEEIPLLVDFLIRITGPPARKFKGQCDYIDERGKQKNFRIGGIVPKDYRVKAKAIRCKIGRRPALTKPLPQRLKMAMWADGQFLKSISTKKKYYEIGLETAWDWK